MTWVIGVGYLASALVFATFCMRTMIPLRVAAMCSNVAFITYGYVGGIYPVLVLHCLLLPMNVWRTIEMVRLTGKMRAAAAGDGVLDWLLPLMEHRRCTEGTVLFRKDDPAEWMFVILSGTIVLEEAGIRLGPGQIAGEMALFAAGRQRTQTALCAEATEIGWIERTALERLCFQNPAVAFHLMRLVTNRLIDDIARAEAARDAAGAGRDQTDSAEQVTMLAKTGD